MDAKEVSTRLNAYRDCERYLLSDTELLSYLEREDSSEEDLECDSSASDSEDEGQTMLVDPQQQILDQIRDEYLELDPEDELVKIKAFKCTSSKNKENARNSCLSQIDPELIRSTRWKNAEHTVEAKDSFLESLLFLNTQDTEKTLSTKQKPLVRQKPRTSFSIHSTSVCRDCWLFACG